MNDHCLGGMKLAGLEPSTFLLSSNVRIRTGAARNNISSRLSRLAVYHPLRQPSNLDTMRSLKRSHRRLPLRHPSRHHTTTTTKATTPSAAQINLITSLL